MKRNRNIASRVVIAALLVVLAGVSLSDTRLGAQIVIQPGLRAEEEIVRPDDRLDDFEELNNTFFVQTSTQAEELASKIRNAAYLENDGKWSEAALEYDAIIRADSSSLAQMPGIDGERVYLGIKEYCRRRLKQFPPKGVEAYRMMVDNKARERLREALKEMSEGAIREIISNYPISGWADEALWYLANVLYERNDFYEAMYCYKRLFEEFAPDDVTISLPAAYARFAVCAREIGRSAAGTLGECRKKIPADIAAAKVRIYDGENHRYVSVSVREYLDKTAEIINEGGDDSFSGLNIQPRKFDHMSLAWRSLQIRSKGDYDACVWRDRIYASLMGFNQTMSDSGDTLLLSMGSRQADGRVLGFYVDSGKHCFRGQKYNSFEDRAALARDYFPSTITIDDAGVYFVDYGFAVDGNGVEMTQRTPMGSSVRQNAGAGRYVSELHCCDKDDGTLNWAQPWEADHVGNRGGMDTSMAREFLHDMCITSAPVRYGAYLYAMVVRSTSDANEIYLACFNAFNGALMWYSHIGGESFLSANTAARRPEMGSRLTVVDNMIYFSTNMGVVGCAGAETGDILWVAKYRIKHKTTNNNRPISPSAIAEPAHVWHDTPPRLVRDVDVLCRGRSWRTDVMLVAPRDSDNVYAYDAMTGQRIWERNLDLDFNNPQQLPQRWINFTDKHVFIVQSAQGQGTAAGYKPRSLTVLETASGREIDFPDFFAKEYGKNLALNDENIVPIRPYVYGRWLVLATLTDIYCFDTENNYELVADVKMQLTEDDKRNFLTGLTDMVLQGTRIFFMRPDQIVCYDLSGGE